MNQYDTKKLKIGTKISDCKIIGITKHINETRDFYILECEKCHRKRELPRKVIMKSNYNGLTHNIGCIYKVPNSKYKKQLSSIWSGMHSRTGNPNQPAYKDYHHVKIKYESFIDFYDDQINAYIEHIEKYGKINTTIDRIDVYGHYESSNIRWATRKEQNDNKKKSVYFKAISPENKCYVGNNQNDFATAHNLLSSKINSCIHGANKTHKGWKFELINKKTYDKLKE